MGLKNKSQETGLFERYVAKYQQRTSVTGDTLLVLPDGQESNQPQRIALTKRGMSFFKKAPEQFEVLAETSSSGTWHTGLFGVFGERIVVKKIDLKNSEVAINGIDTLTAMRHLELAGAKVIPLLAATDETLVSVWVKGKESDIRDESFKAYLRKLKEIRTKLVASGKWKDTWLFDNLMPNNFLLIDPKNSDILNRYVAVDPIQNATDIETRQDLLDAFDIVIS